MYMRRWSVAVLSLLLPVAAVAQNAPDPSQAFGAVTSAVTGYVLAALVAVAVLFGLVLGIRFFMGIARRAVGR
jgi:predicted secreted protein